MIHYGRVHAITRDICGIQSQKKKNYAPVDILSSVLDSRNYAGLLHTHMWGCPVYILEYELASGKKLLKWSPRSRCGVYLGVISTLFECAVDVKFNNWVNLSSVSCGF